MVHRNYRVWFGNSFEVADSLEGLQVIRGKLDSLKIRYVIQPFNRISVSA